jgi:hypothetical protein
MPFTRHTPEGRMRLIPYIHTLQCMGRQFDSRFHRLQQENRLGSEYDRGSFVGTRRVTATFTQGR